MIRNFILLISKFLTLVLFIPGGILSAQQVPDTLFRFDNPHPSYPSGRGPRVLIDGAHHNFHTREGGFTAFAHLLEGDGYRVASLSHEIAGPTVLDQCRILVIANALNASNENSWALPTPSAFTPTEIRTIRKWVEEGGRLLLIADHMPFAGAAQDLGNAFGFAFLNGFAFTGERSWPPSVFSPADNTLGHSPVTTTTDPADRIDRVATFTGSAFRIPDRAIPILVFRSDHWSLEPDTAWQFHDNTPRQSLEGYYQGAIASVGKGKIAVFGEAAMFTAQIVNGQMPVGFNSPDAPQNARFILNLFRWLGEN